MAVIFRPFGRWAWSTSLPTLALLSMVSCGSGSGGSAENVVNSLSLDALLTSQLIQAGLDGDPIDGRIIPEITEPLAELGKRLFFTKSLSGDFDAACASCHHPRLAGGDAMALPIGTDAVDPDLLGPLRAHHSAAEDYDGGPTVPRNSPTTFNVALWDESLFWDGRVQNLESGIATPDSSSSGTADPLAGNTLAAAQARFPVTNEEEMRGFTFEYGLNNTAVRDHLAARLGNFGVGAGEITEDWVSLFRTAFEEPTMPVQDLITFENVVAAIGAYEDSQVFVDTPWKQYVEGNQNAISNAAKRGALLFLREPNEGGAACDRCHSGDFFTDGDYHLTAFPQIGRGKGVPNLIGDMDADYGRSMFVGGMIERFSFRTPALINVTETGPWGHAGSFSDLETLLRYHVDPVSGFANFNLAALPAGMQTAGFVQNTGEVVDQLLLKRGAGTSRLPANLSLSDRDYADLIAFLESLTDPRILDPNFLEDWIARNDAGFTDSQLLLAHDGQGEVY
ncbi:MAG: cytochrome-c peroxidase [Planctomycetes bacterium]|nr:cytochrome-c peroxidase [Planctomycetota bacterium]MCP4770018.1 cytochrome-c peroxidase [Planctomycetota bacterium]MCP4859858.1 cytochrome-c peroxidase [Planctomycetota bacterium]